MQLEISLPKDQLELLELVKRQNETLLSQKVANVWLNDEDVAERFGVSVSLITKWRKNFGLPFSQIGEVRRYSAQKIDTWFAEFSPQHILGKVS
ncbi:helix-turn-helix domain-containing protein [Flectobacillus roseus]|uniref:helix-turn-helix domain-containing protein n=1 Tax=Flectobacillus roseus TaxID=502259 RepID=UPI001411C240|nr:helix-turn-helix domain-containing protein [Flectobacillus roseus]MDI9872131.1 hypothetical protein [Flectobacillus roseus]NBA77295.1 hypothetical protein [Emticicia sp. ODNR4P]